MYSIQYFDFFYILLKEIRVGGLMFLSIVSAAFGFIGVAGIVFTKNDKIHHIGI